MKESNGLRLYKQNKRFMNTLYQDPRTGDPSKVQDSKLINSLARDRNVIERDLGMYRGLLELKQKDLLKPKIQRVSKAVVGPLKGFIYNDYHGKNSKDGYARNQLGTFLYH